jgi:uncharacterized membrane protein (UPF0136 family)
LTATGSSLPQSAPSVPIGTFLLLALSAVFYLWLMVDLTGPQGGSGEALMGQAFESLFVTFFLWIALAVLLIAGGVMGKMPRWVAILALVVHPLSGVGAFVAIDMLSRHAVWALAFPALLPLLIAFYAMWARLPRLRAVFPARITSILVWGAIAVLSLLPLPVSYWGPGTFGR